MSGTQALMASPAYLIAILLHAVVLLVLSCWTIAVYVRERNVRVEAKLAASSEVELAEPQTPQPALDALLDDVEHELDLQATEVDTDDAYQEALGNSAGNQVAEGVAVLGIAGAAGGFGRGGAAASRGGPSSASLGAVRSGLDWLARHRAGDGGWGTLPGGHAKNRRLPTRGDPARTGLAVICYLSAGHSPAEEGPYQELLIEARDWLVRKCGKGRFAANQHAAYNQAIASIALGELLQREDTPELRDATRGAVRCILDWQTSLGWRYSPRRDTDTSITSWMILALKSAEAAGVPVRQRAYERVRAYLDRISKPTGTTKYTLHGSPDPAMNATGLFLRILLGDDRTTPTNRAAARLVAQQTAAAHPRGPDQPAAWYQLYYAALGMFLYGGEAWREFNPQLRDAVVQAQRDDAGCESGSWRTMGGEYDTVLNTCLATLILETYFRYLSPDGEHKQLDVDLLQELNATSLLDDRLTSGTMALNQARLNQSKGALLAAEAAFEEALAELDVRPTREDRLLAAELRARLVEVSLLSGDSKRALRLAEEYMGSLPANTEPEPGITRFLRLAHYARVIELVEPAFAQDASDALREEAAAQLRALGDELRPQLEGLEGKEREELEQQLAQLAQLQDILGYAVDPDGALTSALEAFRGRPPQGEVSPAEWRLVRGLLQRALRFYEGGVRGGARLFARAERDLEAALARGLGDRLQDEERRRSLEQLLEQNLALRIRAQLELGHHAEVLVSVPEFRAAFPRSSFLKALESYERGALIQRVQAGQATQEERDRLVALLSVWVRRDDAPEGAESLAVADLLARWGVREEAGLLFRRALEGELEPEQRVRARLGLLHNALEAGRTVEAQRQLAALPDSVANRLDVRRGRCRLLRQEGRGLEALTDYLDLLRALGDDRPPEFWEVAEQTAQTYVELDRWREAKTFLEGLRRLDPRLGGEGALKDRLVDLMRELDRR